MDDQRLLDELVKKDILTRSVADDLLEASRISGRSAEKILYDKRLADEEDVARVKASLLDVPYKEVDPQSIPEEVLDLVPYDTSRTYDLVPLEQKEDMLVVGMLDPENEQAKRALRFVAKRNDLSLGVYLVTPSVLRAVWRRYVPYQDRIERAVEEVRVGEQEEEEEVGLEETIESSEEAPIIKIVASTLRHAVDVAASDVHIEPQRERLRIRFRVEGDLQEVATLPAELAHPIISRVKVMARLRLDEERIPQDGRFRSTVFGKNIDFRVATFPTPTGEKVAIRVLDPTIGMKSLEELGLNFYHKKPLVDAVEAPHGMTLLTGPTSSGKTTTLYAVMNRLNTESVNIVSLEDPVEYFISGVNQSQVMPEIGYDFASGLRQILRQDPDIIMVGEIRDGETAGLAVNAALTGHLMLSTLHTNNSVGVIPRLMDLGVPDFLLSSSLNLMVAQRLVLELCPNCRVEKEAPERIQDIMEREFEDLDEEVKSNLDVNFGRPYKIYNAQPDENCDICHGEGHSGRTALFEMFEMTGRLSNMVTEDFTEGDLWQEAREQGIVTLRQDGLIKSLQGRVEVEEVLRETAESVKE